MLKTTAIPLHYRLTHIMVQPAGNGMTIISGAGVRARLSLTTIHSSNNLDLTASPAHPLW
jgi:hypothetical protein